MKYKNAIIVLGVLVAIILSPFIGVPRSWKEGVAILLGLLISVLAYVGSHIKKDRVSKPSSVINSVSNQTTQTKPVETEAVSGDVSINSQ